MSKYLPLVAVGLIPIFITTILYWFDKKIFTKVNPILKEVLYGIIFGVIAILGTEYSIPISGASMNVRDAAPLCAGLFFGWKAGIIAGLIGGIERWYAIYWGAGTLTRLACSLATILSGVIAAIFRTVIFDDKNAKPAYGFAIGVVAETLHMLLVIFTNFDNARAAFAVVEACTIPMVTGVALAVGISSFIVIGIDGLLNKQTKKEKIDISDHFQKYLLILMTVAFLLTNGFCVLLQESLAEDESNNLLSYNLQDCVSEINETTNTDLISTVRLVTTEIEKLQDDGEEITTQELLELAKEFDVSEVILVGRDNIVYASSNISYVGYDMTSAEQSNEFAIVFADLNTDYYVQKMESTGIDQQNVRKFAAYRNSNGGYVQVSYDIDKLAEKSSDGLTLMAHNRRIGQNGSIIVANKQTQTIISDFTDKLTGKSLEEVGLSLDLSVNDLNTKYYGNVNGTDVYYSYYIIDGDIIIAMIPAEEVEFNEYVAAYLMSFVEISVFASIFINVYFLIKNSIVKNIKIINSKLNEITSGDLDTVVNVRDTREFEILSDHINTTVNKLKELISEAEQRMAKELDYAAQIQRSSLPIDFPIVDEYDIYASMDPAKEVGGDFYDFYLIDNDKLCFLVADVSGKGIPASLFMMRAMTQMKSFAEYGFEVNDIFTDTNYELTQGNEAGLFVTSWIGILDLKTGHLRYANAGHNPPLIRHPNGQYEYLNSKPGFVLGGMEGIAYKKFEMDIEEGTSIFIYTDGLPEAQNLNHELYGNDRLQNAINKEIGLPSKQICLDITKDIAQFVGEADQFDDMTMSHLTFKKKLQ